MKQEKVLVSSKYAEPELFFNTNLKEKVDLLPRGADQSVKPVQSFIPVLEAQQCIFFPVLPVKDRC